MKRSSVRGRGRFIVIKIVEQDNSHEVLFAGRARVDDPVAVRELFRSAALRGLDFDIIL